MIITMILIDSTAWKWVDGSPLKQEDYSYWTPGEPNNKDDENFCADMWYKGENNQGKWDDVHCTNTYRFICHKLRGRLLSQYLIF